MTADIVEGTDDGSGADTRFDPAFDGGFKEVLDSHLLIFLVWVERTLVYPTCGCLSSTTLVTSLFATTYISSTTHLEGLKRNSHQEQHLNHKRERRGGVRLARLAAIE